MSTFFIPHHSDYETLVAIDSSVQSALDRVISLEGVLKAKLDSITE